MLEQKEDGQVPIVVPYWKSYEETFSQYRDLTLGRLGDACIIVPWIAVQYIWRFGRKKTMTPWKWVAYIKKMAEEGLIISRRTDSRTGENDKNTCGTPVSLWRLAYAQHERRKQEPLNVLCY